MSVTGIQKVMVSSTKTSSDRKADYSLQYLIKLKNYIYNNTSTYPENIILIHDIIIYLD